MVVKPDFRNRLWTRYATTDGTGVVADANNDWGIDLSTPDDYYVEAQAGEVLIVSRVIIYVNDSSFLADKLGTVTLNAGEGINIIVEQDGVEVEDLTGGVPMATVGDIAGQCHDVSIFDGFASGNDTMSARYTFSKHGDFIRLTPGDKLIFRVHGNLAALADGHFLVEGVYEQIEE